MKLTVNYLTHNTADDGELELEIQIQFDAGSKETRIDPKSNDTIEILSMTDTSTGLPYEHEEWMINNPYHLAKIHALVYEELTWDFWNQVDLRIDAQRDEQFS